MIKMAVFCPVTNSRVTYLVCQECEEKVCRTKKNTPSASCENALYTRGDIVFVSGKVTDNEITEPQNHLSEQEAGRPAVIVSNDKCNTYSPVIEIVFLTTAKKRWLPTHVNIKSTRYPSIALCEAVYSVDISRITFNCGRCTASEIKKIDQALKISLDLE